MTATERLRQLLDERGVEHIDYKDEATWWSNGDVECAYIQRTILNDELGQLSFMATPEQAVEATLGRGTCKDIAETPKFSDKTRFECSACGYEYSAVGGFGCDYGDAPDFDYCPHCGRKVVE